MSRQRGMNRIFDIRPVLAPALLGVVARARLRAAAVTGAAAGAWGLLLLVTPTIPATVPVLAGLLVGRL